MLRQGYGAVTTTGERLTILSNLCYNSIKSSTLDLIHSATLQWTERRMGQLLIGRAV